MGENIKELRIVIERLHNCKAVHAEKTIVVEKFGKETVWSGVVHTYRLEGCPKADFCYAWTASTDLGSMKYYTVLKLPPIDSPEKAVRASIVHNHKTGKL